jgi:hypothetical protein
MKGARILLIVVLLGMIAMVCVTSGLFADSGLANATPMPGVHATLTSAAGEWQAQLTAIAGEKASVP